MKLSILDARRPPEGNEVVVLTVNERGIVEASAVDADARFIVDELMQGVKVKGEDRCIASPADGEGFLKAVEDQVSGSTYYRTRWS